jgi:hypothetical protein
MYTAYPWLTSRGIALVYYFEHVDVMLVDEDGYMIGTVCSLAVPIRSILSVSANRVCFWRVPRASPNFKAEPLGSGELYDWSPARGGFVATNKNLICGYNPPVSRLM